MQEYQDVVKNRFNADEDPDKSIYAENHPIGKYIRKNLYAALDEFILWYSKDHKVAESKLLDAGCGFGGMLGYLMSKGFVASNTTGMDFSETRIAGAKKAFPLATFLHADITQFNLPGQKFSVITSFDLFSHLPEKNQLESGLKNLWNHLEDDGVFLWYDIYANDHFAPPKGADSWGFSTQQMIDLATASGFQFVYQKSFFKKFFNRYNSVYQVKRLSPGLVRFLERILPGSPGNSMIVFKKIKTA